MSDTPNLKLPMLAPSQAQKEMTHNEALAALDVLVQAAIINATSAAPPAAPAEGDSYIVAASPTGAWAGKAGQLAWWSQGWKFTVPEEGWRVYDRATKRALTYDGAAWGAGTSAPQIPSLALGWIGYGGGFASPRYYRFDGRVLIEGLMQAGTNGVVFTLQPGYRPAEKLMFACWGGGGGAYRVDVHANGDVEVLGSNAVFSSLSGIHFPAAAI